MRAWLARVRDGLLRPGVAPQDRHGEARTVELGGAMGVVFRRDAGVVSETYVGIRGTPSRVVRDTAAERLTRSQLAAGEEPWLPEVAARLGVGPDGPAQSGEDDAAPA
jgi:hypothetical protein